MGVEGSLGEASTEDSPFAGADLGGIAGEGGGGIEFAGVVLAGVGVGAVTGVEAGLGRFFGF